MPDIKRVAIAMLALAGVVSLSWWASTASADTGRAPIARTVPGPQEGAGYLVLRMVVVPPDGADSGTTGRSGRAGQGATAGHRSQRKRRAGEGTETSGREGNDDATASR